MPIKITSKRLICLLALLFFSNALATSQQAEEPTTDSVFAEAPFDQWVAQGDHQEVPWQVQTSAGRLSFHQRLIANIHVEISGPEMLKRSHDDHITLLVEVRNGQGVSFRDYGLLEVSNMKPEMKRSDVEFSWQAYAVPGQYELSVALWDKKSGEHNFMRRLFHVDAYKDDPLPEMWRGLPAFEFWGTKREGPDYIFHTDIQGRPNLPLATRRPIEMEILLDETPSAEVFRGSYGYYNHYLAAALPTFKVLNQMDLKNGARKAAALDLVQRHVVFEQDDGKDLDWAVLRKTLSIDSGPGKVSVKDLQNHQQQSPVFLRDEIIRRLKTSSSSRGESSRKPLRVFILLGSPTDFYTFPKLPEIETGEEKNCVIYYLQFEFRQREFTAGTGNVEKLLKPLRVRSFQVESADDVRKALGKIMEELSRL